MNRKKVILVQGRETVTVPSVTKPAKPNIVLFSSLV